jgi:hypothetical protein
MSLTTAEAVYEQVVKSLPVAERLRLMQKIASELPQPEQTDQSLPRRLKWSDVRGMVPYPFFGEDAQAYISRTRRESDEHREQQLRRKSAQ